MSIYSKNETGTRAFRSRLNIGYRKLFDCDFGYLIPFCTKFILPGDVGKIGAECFIRYQPTIAPPLTRSWARLRWFFVPLRLIEPNAEKIITGSDNGKVISGDLPKFSHIFVKDTSQQPDVVFTVNKWSFDDYLGMPCGNYKDIIASGNTASLPASYWYKGYCRIGYDYYLDENFREEDDFETWWLDKSDESGRESSVSLISPCLHKDYFTSALPWQLKGTAPTISLNGTSTIDFTDLDYAGSDWGQFVGLDSDGNPGTGNVIHEVDNKQYVEFNTSSTPLLINKFYENLSNAKISNSTVDFNMSDLRTMAAQTRVFERLARCGSRYTEYLHANFGVAPADGTLQRSQYLGGFSQPIVTTEVVQTGGDSTEVGTLRGHGISAGGNSIGVHRFKEFGLLYGLLDVMPELVYTQGINRELTYKSRFDFFNPSFQHLSEQEVRNGELYIDFTNTQEHPHQNDEVFGYQAIYNELRSSRDEVVGDLRDTLSYWQQGITFASRPNLNRSFLKSSNYLSDFKRPFQVLNGAMPIICDVGNHLDFWRPMVKYGTPGLIDHL